MHNRVGRAARCDEQDELGCAEEGGELSGEAASCRGVCVSIMAATAKSNCTSPGGGAGIGGSSAGFGPAATRAVTAPLRRRLCRVAEVDGGEVSASASSGGCCTASVETSSSACTQASPTAAAAKSSSACGAPVCAAPVSSVPANLRNGPEEVPTSRCSSEGIADMFLATAAPMSESRISPASSRVPWTSGDFSSTVKRPKPMGVAGAAEPSSDAGAAGTCSGRFSDCDSTDQPTSCDLAACMAACKAATAAPFGLMPSPTN
mmetsp:Transcript_18072/g.63492  ORF Transcript_18072/g.63492 Transcript_18072/m.63492 type:complete len:262 (+) Transcript_18072:340-1125(+)